MFNCGRKHLYDSSLKLMSFFVLLIEEKYGVKCLAFYMSNCIVALLIFFFFQILIVLCNIVHYVFVCFICVISI